MTNYRKQKTEKNFCLNLVNLAKKSQKNRRRKIKKEREKERERKCERERERERDIVNILYDENYEKLP